MPFTIDGQLVDLDAVEGWTIRPWPLPPARLAAEGDRKRRHLLQRDVPV